MSTDESWPFPPGLLGSAGEAIRGAILDELHGAAINDLSVPEATVLATMATRLPEPAAASAAGAPPAPVAPRGRPVDGLVSKGYLERSSTPGAEPALQLTQRGRGAADAVRLARSRLEERLGERVPAEWMRQTRAVLVALSDLGGGTGAARSRRRQAAQLQRISPMFVVQNLVAAMDHYRALGFEAHPDDDGGGHAWVTRERAGIHLLEDHDHDRTHGGLAYIRVADAVALHQEWTGVQTTRPVRLTPYGMREGAHVDPDGNEILFGEPIDQTDA